MDRNAAIAICNKYCTMSQNDELHPTLLKDETAIGSMVLLLDRDDTDKAVVKLILKTFWNLSKDPKNRKQLCQQMGLIVSLQTLSLGERLPEAKELHQKAKQLYKILSKLDENRTTPTRPSKPSSQSSSRPQSSSGPSNNSFFMGSSNKRAKLITLQIEGLDETNKSVCEKALLEVKGVVSFLFLMAQKRCQVRVLQGISAEQLCKAIAEKKVLHAEQVVKNQSGEEVTVSYGRHPSIADEKPEDDDSLYLPEEDIVEDSDKAMTRPGEQGEGSGWFSGVSNFLSNSLYW